MCNPSSGRSSSEAPRPSAIKLRRCAVYRAIKSSVSTGAPSLDGVKGARDSAVLTMDAMSSLSSPPSLEKYLKPLRYFGRWLAVIMIAPSAATSGKTVAMYIAGVEAMPQHSTCTPQPASVSQTMRESSGPVKRESRPTATVSSSRFFSVFAASHKTKARVRSTTASGVKSTGFPGSPAIATPRISLPFCNAP